MDKAGISETSEPARINRTPTTMLTVVSPRVADTVLVALSYRVATKRFDYQVF